MMGKKIDRIALSIVCVLLCFGYFLFTFKSIPWAMLAAFVFMALGYNLFLAFTAWKEAARARRHCAGQILSVWMMDTGDGATLEAARLAARTFCLPPPVSDGEGVYTRDGEKRLRIMLLKRHPSDAPLGINEVIECLQSNPSRDDLVILTTAKADPGAIDFAAAMKSPRVRLAGAEEISAWLAQDELTAAPVSTPSTIKKQPLRKLSHALFYRIQPGKAILYGLILLAMYFVLGGYVYLLVSLTLILLSALRLKKPRVPRTLFP